MRVPQFSRCVENSRVFKGVIMFLELPKAVDKCVDECVGTHRNSERMCGETLFQDV